MGYISVAKAKRAENEKIKQTAGGNYRILLIAASLIASPGEEGKRGV